MIVQARYAVLLVSSAWVLPDSFAIVLAALLLT